MEYQALENEELLRLSLNAIADRRDAEAMDLAKTLLMRDPEHLHARYLLAAHHAQLGMVDEAEAGLRRVVADPASLPIARLQLGQLLLSVGKNAEAATVLEPLRARNEDLGAFSSALIALSHGDRRACVDAIEAGLGMEQQIPALAADMRRLRDALGEEQTIPASPARLLSGYGTGA